MSSQTAIEFRWFSPLGVSVILFLGFGVIHALAGIFAPIISRISSNTGGFSQTQVDLLMVLVLAFGSVQLSVSWLALRQGKAWGLLLLVVMDLVELIAWLVYGLRSDDWGAPLFWYDVLILLPATILGLIGLR